MEIERKMSLYGLNSGTAASLVLARRGLRLSERLPRVCNAFLQPVESTPKIPSDISALNITSA